MKGKRNNGVALILGQMLDQQGADMPGPGKEEGDIDGAMRNAMQFFMECVKNGDLEGCLETFKDLHEFDHMRWDKDEPSEYEDN